MKVWNYMFIMLTMMMFLSLLGFKPVGMGLLSDIGVEINSTTGTITTGDISNSEWYSKIFNLTDGILVIILAVGSVIVGLYAKQFEWKMIFVPFFGLFVVKFVQFGVGLINLSNELWLDSIIGTIFLPLTAMFIFSIIEWFSGGGTG